MALMVMDWDYNLQAELSLPKSYQITRSYYGLGSFEVKIGSNASGAATLQDGRVVFFSDALHKAAIIEKVVEKNGEISASGKLLKGIAARRICVPPATDDGHFGWDRFIGTAEAAYHHYAAAHLYAPKDSKRKIPRLVPGEIRSRGTSLPWQSRFGNLEALFADIGETTEIGWDILPDFPNKRYLFVAQEGRDLTSSLGMCVVSEKNRNASGIVFTLDSTASRSTAYVGGEGEDENRLIISVGNEAEGVERRECWVDAGSIYDMDMIQLAGQNKLDTAERKETLTADLMDDGLCQYERDFDIGDRIILQTQTATTATRLLEVCESYSDGERKLKATFGTAPVDFKAEILAIKNQMVR